MAPGSGACAGWSSAPSPASTTSNRSSVSTAAPRSTRPFSRSATASLASGGRGVVLIRVLSPSNRELIVGRKRRRLVLLPRGTTRFGVATRALDGPLTGWNDVGTSDSGDALPFAPRRESPAASRAAYRGIASSSVSYPSAPRCIAPRLMSSTERPSTVQASFARPGPR
jgi:hypothetical protein